MTKIDVKCNHCNSVLRVASAHAGKKMRCPSCQNLTIVPEGNRAVDSGEIEVIQSQHSENPSAPKTAPPASPVEIGAPANRANSVASLIMGIIGVVVSMVCGGCFVPALILLNLFGLYWAIRSKGGVKQAAIIMNLLALVIELFLMWWLFS